MKIFLFLLTCKFVFLCFPSVLYFRCEKKFASKINSRPQRRLRNESRPKFFSFLKEFHCVCLYKFDCIKVCKMIANQFSCLLCSILKVLEVVAPFKHFNKLKEFVAMKLPAGFPVRIGWCGLYFWSKFPSLVLLWSSRNVSRYVTSLVTVINKFSSI